jgi:hypothetical protein
MSLVRAKLILRIRYTPNSARTPGQWGLNVPALQRPPVSSAESGRRTCTLCGGTPHPHFPLGNEDHLVHDAEAGEGLSWAILVRTSGGIVDGVGTRRGRQGGVGCGSDALPDLELNDSVDAVRARFSP